MKKSFWSLSLTTALIISSVPAFSGSASAESMDNLNSEQKEIQQQREEISGEIDTKNSDITKVVDQQEEFTAQIKVLDQQIETTNAEITAISDKIDETNANIEELKVEIEELKKKIEERTALLEERARALQLTGGSVSYIDVLLGAESFGDFIDRFSAVNTLVTADREIMEEQQKDQEMLEEKESEVQSELEEQEAQKEELDGLLENLDQQKNEKNALIANLEKQQSEIEEQKEELEQRDSELYELEASLENQILAEQERLAELARQREKEKQEEQRKADEAAKSSNSSSNSSTPPATSNPPASPVSPGTWTRPAAGTITTYFGSDTLNGESRYHYGMDISGAPGTTISAAASGYVTTATTSSSYGNFVMITHSINGQTITTLYAHMNSLSVSQGQYVEKGQKIGGMGNTGYSFGTHLHFELHEGGWNGAKSNAVDPRKYVSF